jgi:hypothetical protein
MREKRCKWCDAHLDEDNREIAIFGNGNDKSPVCADSPSGRHEPMKDKT